MSKSASLSLGDYDPDDWLIFSLGYPGGAPVRLVIAGSTEENVNLLTGWQTLAFQLKSLRPRDGMITLQSDYEHPAPGDSRNLCLMIGNPVLGEPDAYIRNFTTICKALSRETVVDAYPVNTTYETSSLCNMRCIMCITKSDLGVFLPGRASGLKQIEPVCRELLPYTSKVQWHATGEMFTTDEIWRALKLTEEYRPPHNRLVEILTNGQLLDAGKRRALIDSPVTNVIFSVDAATPETYARLRGGDFVCLTDNIRALSKEDTDHSLTLSMFMVIMRENIHELPAFVRFARDLGVSNVIYSPLFPMGTTMPIQVGSDGFTFYYKQQLLMYYPRLAKAMIREAEQAAAECGVYITETPCVVKDYEQFTREDLEYPLSPEDFDLVCDTKAGKPDLIDSLPTDRERYSACPFPWTNAFVTADGMFSPCHYIMYSGGLESLEGKSFQDVWNSPIMQDIRKGIKTGEVHPKCRQAMCQFVTRII